MVVASSEKFMGFATTPLLSPSVFATVPNNTPSPATTPGSALLLAAAAPLTNLRTSSAATSIPCSIPRRNSCSFLRDTSIIYERGAPQTEEVGKDSLLFVPVIFRQKP